METLLVDGDRLYVGGQGRVYSTQGNGRWTATAPIPGGYEVAVLARADGRLFAGTYRGGVFESIGSTDWIARNEGLSGAAARTVVAMASRGSTLVAGTDGASLFRRSLSDHSASWQPFRSGIPSNLSWNTGALVVQGDRLVAGAGGNGAVYLNDDERQPWREITYDPSLGNFLELNDLFDTGTSLLGGGTYRLYRSPDGGETWTATDLNRGLLGTVRFARAGEMLVALAAKPPTLLLYASNDDGQTWRLVEEMRGVQAFDVEVYRDRIYVARLDGLWSISVDEIHD
jgi:photosystem II stability/assembly factor-like uncharacterized protein